MKKSKALMSAVIAVGACVAAFAAEVTIRRSAAYPDTVVFEWRMRMKDGVELYTLGVAPASGERHPIVVTRNPYVKEELQDMEKWAKSHREYVRRGYARVHQHCRGCGMSGGDWIPYESEREDGLELLEFVRRLPWYNGEIYLSGGSYCASVHWAYLDTDPQDVKGAALMVQEVDRYNICYRNGFFKIGLHGNWFVKGYKKKDRTLKRDDSVTFRQFPLCDFPKRRFGEEVPTMSNVLGHPRADDPFWSSNLPGSGVDYRNAFKKSSMPILLNAAFYDIYTEGLCEMWRETPVQRKANCALLIEAYGHSGAAPKDPPSGFMKFPGGSRREAGAGALDWFDSIRSGSVCSNAAPGKTRYYALWENAWKEARSLENGKRKVGLKLGEGIYSYRYDSLRTPPEFPGSGGICFGGMAVQPPPSVRDDVISFLLPAVQEQMDVRGRMEAELSVSSDCADTCFYVRVSVDKGDGAWLLLRDDIASLASGSPYVPGTKRTIRFRFADHAFRLSKGDRLRVDVASANPQFAPHPNVVGDAFLVKRPKVAENTVFASESQLTIFAD